MPLELLELGVAFDRAEGSIVVGQELEQTVEEAWHPIDLCLAASEVGLRQQAFYSRQVQKNLVRVVPSDFS
jgi:hypothetical protein